VPVRRLRATVVLAVALLGGAVTAFCGPIAFVGIAVPHLARLLVDTSDHRVLLPVAALVGAAVVLACVVAGHPPGTEVVVPLNVVTSLVGAPGVIAVLLRSRRFAVAVS
jgi:iron complex transport system permease protein